MKSKAIKRFFLSALVWFLIVLICCFGLALSLFFLFSNPDAVICILIGPLLIFLSIILLVPIAKRLSHEVSLLIEGAKINAKLRLGMWISEDDEFILEEANALYNELYSKD